MRKLAIAAAALASVGAFAAVAQAGSLGRPCTSAPESQWLTLDALRARAEAEGYRVQRAKIKAACGEIYALDRNGARVELFLDPASGRIVATQ
ncbi:PepSY domain-containing protein [Neoroseomonas soli]|uniref:PepSY domain-containing protein n=1 Tax=Neoroseomonas soli TaxID=1081025 RepID=A0A9X9X106_9PROT|nr:PepSY domain-containing protein [Neoroseomonas soli]MBR0673085.1 PepSY domain-containing protein [Neoroseomonas soli]